MVQFTLILDNLRSAYNVGTILRTCDALGVSDVIACGTTPYPQTKNDHRDPVVINRNTREIAKSALGAEQTVNVVYISDTCEAIHELKTKDFTIYGLEQSPSSLNLRGFVPHLPAALIVGNEVSGISNDILRLCDTTLEIPQRGAKESLNVGVATGIALYELTKELEEP